MSLVIRSFEKGDQSRILDCIAELQEAERRLDPRLRPGAEIAQAYLAELQARCIEQAGAILVAEQAGEVVGFAAVQTHVPYVELDDPPGEFALVSDLVVLTSARHQGVGRALLESVEQFARSEGVTELRIGVLAANAPARHLYHRLGFSPQFEVFAKRL